MRATRSWCGRSAAGAAAGPGGWANPDGEVDDETHSYPVRARPVQDAGTLAAVTGAYAAKDGDSP
jgi:hypothetical protein